MTPIREWGIVLGLSLGVCVSNSFASFSYGLILPAMREDLAWNYAQAGWINTANALGYIFGAAATFMLIRRVTLAGIFSAGLIGVSIFLLFSGLTSDFKMLTLWRILAGIAGAPAFIAGSALVAALFPDDPKKNALGIALYFGGGGVGMILSGAALPVLFEQYGASVWPISWIALGVGSLIFCALSIWAALQVKTAPQVVKETTPLPTRQMLGELAGYGLFAIGYIVYLTFIVAWMKVLPASYLQVSLVWGTVGLGIIASPFIWRSILAKYASGTPLALVCAFVALGTLLPVFWTGAGGLFLSAAFFGLAVFIGPGSITSFSRKNLPRDSWGKSVSLFTLIFAIGQTIGPVGAGWIIDATGDIRSGLIFAGVILSLGVLAALRQKPLG